MPVAEFTVVSRVITSVGSPQLPLAILGSDHIALRILSDNREDGRRFVFCREFTTEIFLRCYRQAHQEDFGMLEVVTMVEFLMLRLKCALNKLWMVDVPQLRRSIIAGRAEFKELRLVVKENIQVWGSLREYVYYTGRDTSKVSSIRVRWPYCIYCLPCGIGQYVLGSPGRQPVVRKSLWGGWVNLPL